MSGVRATFVGSGDAFGSGGRFQACVHVRVEGEAGEPGASEPVSGSAGAGAGAAGEGPAGGSSVVLLDCGATTLTALKGMGLDPGEVDAVCVSHLHGDHFAGLPFLLLDGQFAHRTAPLTVVGPPGTRQRLADAMELMFPGSGAVRRGFPVRVVELEPGVSVGVAGAEVTGWEVDHPSGAPPLALRVALGGRVVAYTGDTAWSEGIVRASRGADLLVAEAYTREKPVPYHLRLADLRAHRDRLGARRVVLTHMSPDMLGHDPGPGFEAADDGYVVRV